MRGGGYDFVTIRNNMDSSTYCIDLVCKLAKENPELTFLLIGKGKIFNYIEKPDNVIWINKHLTHAEVLHYADCAKCALMPTRRDTQGVMSCELITYGIPLITSDLSICKEIFGSLANVSYIQNNDKDIAIKENYIELLKNFNRNKVVKFDYSHTVRLEEELIKGKENC